MQLTILVAVIVALVVLYLNAKKPKKKIITFDEFMESLSYEAIEKAEIQFNIKLTLDIDSIKQIETILDEISKQYKDGKVTEDEANKEAFFWSSYVGETIKIIRPGKWQKDSQHMGENAYPLVFDENSETYPFAWCFKRIINGEEDNIWNKVYTLFLANKEKENSSSTDQQ